MTKFTVTYIEGEEAYAREHEAEDLMFTDDGVLHLVTGDTTVAVYNMMCWLNVTRDDEAKVFELKVIK